MPSFEVAARFDAPPEVVWGFVSWDGMPRLTQGGFFTRADFPAGPRIEPGALRRVHLREGPPFVERLEEYRPQDFFYRYRLVDIDEAQWRTAWLAIEQQVFDFIRKQL